MRYVNRVFLGGRLTVDGNEFIGCQFDKTVLVVTATAPVSFNGCTFRGVHWEFDGPARTMIEFLVGMHHGAGEGGQRMVESIFDIIRKPPAET
jgi:hypothetical protein